MEWKERKTRLDELEKQARERQDDVGALVSDSVGNITEQLEQLHKSVSHIEDRLGALTSQLATLEARVHEEVE